MRVRAAPVFALLLVAGGLAKEFGLLPQTTDVEGRSSGDGSSSINRPMRSPSSPNCRSSSA